MAFDRIQFGDRIRESREKLGMTQEELAEKADTSREHICHLERGYRSCSFELLVELSEDLGVSTDYLLKGEEEKQEVPKTRAEIRDRFSVILSELSELRDCL